MSAVRSAHGSKSENNCSLQDLPVLTHCSPTNIPNMPLRSFSLHCPFTEVGPGRQQRSGSPPHSARLSPRGSQNGPCIPGRIVSVAELTFPTAEPLSPFEWPLGRATSASEATTCFDLVYLKLTGLGAETFPNLLVE